MTRHVLGFLGVFLSILFLPYWIYIQVLFIAIILVPFFWEGILFALLVNVIFGDQIDILTLPLSPLPVLTLIVLIILLPLREKLRLHVSR